MMSQSIGRFDQRDKNLGPRERERERESTSKIYTRYILISYIRRCLLASVFVFVPISEREREREREQDYNLDSGCRLGEYQNLKFCSQRDY